MKSLCLNHFDNNTLAGARFVVDAVKPFNKDDYYVDEDNPYKVRDNLISLNRWKDITDYSVNGVIAKMKSVLAAVGSSSASYPEYIGDCLYGDFEWISLTFDMSVLGMESAEQDNNELNKFYIEIGTKYYKMKVSPTDKVTGVTTPCSFGATIYRYSF